MPVYFYRDDNGGCVLFDQLGHPWPIHSCWQSHCAIGNRLTNTHAVKHFSKSLDDLGYNGRFYNPTRQVRHRPIRSLVTETVSGYVVDNESLLDPPATIFLRASKQSSSAPFARLFVSASDGKSVPFLMPYPDVEQIEDFEIVTAAGIWVKRGVKWVLLLQKIKIENPIAGSERSVSFIHAVTPFICNICLKEIEAADYWGYDEKLKLECNTCSVARGKYSASDFIALCKSITDRHSPKSDSATAP